MKHMRCTDVDRYDAPLLGLEGTHKMALRLISEDSVWIELEPGGHTPYHRHEDKERMVIMSGHGTLKLENEEREIHPLDFIEVSDEHHQMVNTGNESLSIMCFRNQK